MCARARDFCVYDMVTYRQDIARIDEAENKEFIYVPYNEQGGRILPEPPSSMDFLVWMQHKALRPCKNNKDVTRESEVGQCEIKYTRLE